MVRLNFCNLRFDTPIIYEADCSIADPVDQHIENMFNTLFPDLRYFLYDKCNLSVSASSLLYLNDDSGDINIFIPTIEIELFKSVIQFIITPLMMHCVNLHRL